MRPASNGRRLPADETSRSAPLHSWLQRWTRSLRIVEPKARKTQDEAWTGFLSEADLHKREARAAVSKPSSHSRPTRRWWSMRAAVIALAVVAVAEGIVVAFLLIPRVAADEVVGTIVVTSTPPGATVHVNDLAVGTTPYKGELAPGTQRVSLKLGEATWSEEMAISSGREAAVHVVWPTGSSGTANRAKPGPRRSNTTLAQGWLSIVIPVPAQIYEKGTLLGTTETPRIMVPVGRHQLDIVNAALGLKAQRTVQVVEGKTAVVDIEVPRGVVAINALPWAEVSVGSRALGQTPLANVSLPIGSHELVFRHPELGERRRTVVVTAGQKVRVGIDMRKE